MAVMDLVAGDEREIVLALAVDDWTGLADERRFDAFLSLGAGLDPTWLDEFSRAAREATDRDAPADFLDAREELPESPSERTLERVDRAWVDAVAEIPDDALTRVAARWIDRMQAEGDDIPTGDREVVFGLTRDLVAFCRSARDSSDADVLFAWML